MKKVEVDKAIRDLPVEEMTPEQVRMCYDVFVRPYLPHEANRINGWSREVMNRMMDIDTFGAAEALSKLSKLNDGQGLRDLLLLQRSMRGDENRLYVCHVQAEGFPAGQASAVQMSVATVLVAEDSNDAHYASIECCLPRGAFSLVRAECIDCGLASDLGSDIHAIIHLQSLRGKGARLVGVLDALSSECPVG